MLAGVRDELTRLDPLMAAAAPVLNPPGLREETQWRCGQVEDGRAVGDHPATARRLASARARWLRIR